MHLLKEISARTQKAHKVKVQIQALLMNTKCEHTHPLTY